MPMASSGPIQRPSKTAQASDTMPQKDSSMEASPQKGHGNSFSFTCPLSIPSNSEAAAIRMIKNLVYFGLYYLLFVYIVLFIALIPQRKISLVYLVATKEIAFLYLLLLRALPNSSIIHKIIDKRFLLFLLCIITGVLMILTEAGLHLLFTLVSTIPVILVHASFWREDLHFANSEEGSAAAAAAAAAGELVPILQNQAVGYDADESIYSV